LLTDKQRQKHYLLGRGNKQKQRKQMAQNEVKYTRETSS